MHGRNHSMVACAGLWFFLAGSTALAKEKGSTAERQYDLYQVSIQARHCKLKVLVNGIPNENLSMNASHSSAASAPMYRQDLKPRNTITLRVEEADEETDVSLNVVGVTMERQVISTDEPGNVLALSLDARTIAASKTKVFSARFKASFRKAEAEARSSAIAEEEAQTYANYFAELLRSKNSEKLTSELLPFYKRSPEANGLSDAQLQAKFSGELGSFLENVVFFEHKGTPIEVKTRTTTAGTGYELRMADGEGLVDFYEKADRDKKKHFVAVVIEKIKGKIQIAKFKLVE
jgi:hypothetical protein